MTDCVFIPVGLQRYERVQLDQIRYFQAEGNWVDLFTTNRSYRLSTNIGQIETQLNDRLFVRVSRRHIVNVCRVTAIYGNDVVIDNDALPIGKQYRATLVERLPILRTKAEKLPSLPEVFFN
jgi:DNA-binding LytR/AlgR family response regulator